MTTVFYYSCQIWIWGPNNFEINHTTHQLIDHHWWQICIFSFPRPIVRIVVGICFEGGLLGTCCLTAQITASECTWFCRITSLARVLFMPVEPASPVKFHWVQLLYHYFLSTSYALLVLTKIKQKRKSTSLINMNSSFSVNLCRKSKNFQYLRMDNYPQVPTKEVKETSRIS